MLETGIRDVRNQGVLLRGTNDKTEELLDLCFALLDDAKIMPYYFYMCDMIPNSEHWRLSLAEAQQLQHDIMGYLPGFATPRFICDVLAVGKRWGDTVPAEYDRELRISLLDQELPDRCRDRMTSLALERGGTSTTTRSTCCRKPGRSTGGRRSGLPCRSLSASSIAVG